MPAERAQEDAEHVVLTLAVMRLERDHVTRSVVEQRVDPQRLCRLPDAQRRTVADVAMPERTGMLGLIANSRYPAHVKLWLQHVGQDALARLCERLAAAEYAAVARMVEQRP